MRKIFIAIVVIALLVQFLLLGARHYVQNINPKENGFRVAHSKSPVLDGVKNVLFIGGTSGIGRHVAESVIQRGINVTVVGRSKPKEREFIDNSLVKFISADLTSMVNAKNLVETIKNEKYDVVFFTTGITIWTLEHTKEGIELDLSISYLSRQVIVDGLIANGLDKVKLDSGRKPRIFLMGAPGVFAEPELEDINWENPEKNRNIPRHLNTHIYNEALVHYYSIKYPSIEFYGLNPGMVVTSGFEQALGSLTVVLKPLVNSLFQSGEEYSENVLIKLLANPEIKTGALFNTLGNEIEPNGYFIDNIEEKSKKLVDLNHDLLKRKNLD